jgi:predicted CopG family antitoxin
MSSKPLKQIAIDEENYLALKNLGRAGDSYNDVITEILKKTGARSARSKEAQDSKGKSDAEKRLKSQEQIAEKLAIKELLTGIHAKKEVVI